ncbi:putative zn2 cys6 dna-binding protein [Golovinomyces cichoracearum]|uniref:Putative zn2 cys6 dna-binding protein n=1 Tax=Golovinomyces cichoracearum TaxID=62708 RepID=A0A420IFA1_9PEZI|nr:putative zn2 cys6 dna-binding protein [Golovinomyces cichoracearum]
MIKTTVSNQNFRARNESTISLTPTYIHDNIVSAHLDNPSDALEILAQVIDRADNGIAAGLDPCDPRNSREATSENFASKVDKIWSYQPFEENLISVDTICCLFTNYKELYHPYFPIVPQESFDPTRLPWMSKNEPYLFSAILTVASRDNGVLHQICYDHMQKLILMLLGGTNANINAVEGLLLLSQWVPCPLNSGSSMGRGEEDRITWMYIGMALRLAYYIGLDRTLDRSDIIEEQIYLYRKELVWAACYICDRQVSVRVGKRFWTRGPDPKSNNVPTLRQISASDDNTALAFQANLEMTHIFSNVHNLLYSSKGDSLKEILTGRYTEYLDDFRACIRGWNETWGALPCSPRVKTSLLLTYNYLRLYVNAFAYQATVSRMLSNKEGYDKTPDRDNYVPFINAAAPDARFIYEALDAAKSLICIFNDSVEPAILRHMPITIYLFIIYSAVFLYKVRITTNLNDNERRKIRVMIQKTIERLQTNSNGPNDMGSRYAHLLQMLWRKVPKRNERDDIYINDASRSISDGVAQFGNDCTMAGSEELALKSVSSDQNLNNLHPTTPNNLENRPQTNRLQPYFFSNPKPTGFSWLDLDATWNFATQDNGGDDSSTSSICDFKYEITNMSENSGHLSPTEFNTGIFGASKVCEGERGCGLIF